MFNLSPFWKLEFWNWDVSRATFSLKALGHIQSHAFLLAFWCCQYFLSSLACRCIIPVFASIIMWYSPWSLSGFRVHLTPVWPCFNWLHLQWPYFQIGHEFCRIVFNSIKLLSKLYFYLRFSVFLIWCVCMHLFVFYIYPTWSILTLNV